MKVIVLAAGKGERLYPLTRNMPKSLIHIGNGMTILESQIRVFTKCGIEKVFYVCGYKVEQIEARLKDINHIDIEVIYNPFYDVSNNLVSAWMATKEMNEDFVLLNGDDVFKNEVLYNLLKCKDAINVVISRKDKYDAEDMKVICKGDKITRIGKHLPLDKANGESIGMIKFSRNGVAKFNKTLEEMVREKGKLSEFYLAAVQGIIDEGYPVNYCECHNSDWAEIDFHPDLEMMKRKIRNYQSIIE